MSLFTEKVEIGIQEAELETQKALAEFPPALRYLTLFLAIALFPTYFVAKAVSHGVWSNKYESQSFIAKPSFTNSVNPKISDINVTTLGNSQFAAAFMVTNENLDLSLPDTTFTVTFYNDQKQVLYKYNGKLFLLPNQKKYVSIPTFNSSEKVSFSGFEFTEELNWQKRINVPNVELTTSLPNFYMEENPLSFVVEGNFTNNSPYQLKQVRLTFILFDRTGAIIGSSQRDESTIKPFERRTYKQLWPNTSNQNISRVLVEASTNVLDYNNLSISTDYSGSSSNLDRPQNER